MRPVSLLFSQHSNLSYASYRGMLVYSLFYRAATERNVKDNYLDAYLQVIKDKDPLKTCLVFSCGMGAVRTTYAMVAASLVRRRQLILRGMNDPYAGRGLGTSSGSGLSTVSACFICRACFSIMISLSSEAKWNLCTCPFSCASVCLYMTR